MTNGGRFFPGGGGLGQVGLVCSRVHWSEPGQPALLPSSWTVYSSLGLESVYFERRMSGFHHGFHWLIVHNGWHRRVSVLVQATFAHTVRAKMVKSEKRL